MRKIVKCAFCLVALLAALCASTVFAEIIVPDNPVNLVAGKFTTSALYLHEGTGANSLFDRNVATRFITKPKPDPSNGVTPTAIIHFQDRALTVNAYRVCGQSSEGTAGRYPKAWALFGSNDGGGSWVKLDERSGQTGWSKGESRQFTFDNIESYSSFKFEILANNGDATYTVIGELELFNFERTDLLEVGYTGYRVGAPAPFYGGVTGLAEDATVTLDCPVTRANDVDTGDYYTLQGFTIVDHDGSLLKKGTVDDLPYTYIHKGYAKLTWDWKSHIDEMNVDATDDITVPKKAAVNEITAYFTSQDSVDNIFDNNLANRWLATSISQTKVPNWVQYRFLDAPRIVTGFKMTMSTTYYNTSRYPMDFRFQGSNDGVNYTDLLVVADAGGTLPNPEKVFYSFPNATPYSYYRLYMTKSGDGTWLQLGEMEMYTIYRPDSIRVVGEPKSYGHPEPDYGFQTNLVGGTDYVFHGPTETLTISDDQVSECDGYTLYVNGVSSGFTPSTTCRYCHRAGDIAILTWHFADSYRQTYATKGGGNVSVSERWGDLGEVVSVTATVGENGAPFVGWTGDVPEGQEQNPTVTYAIDGPRKLTAMFALPLYVDAANGSDEDNDGTAPDKAFATLQKALSECLAHGSITVGPGTYLVDGGALAIDKNITLESTEGPERTIVEVNGEVPGFVLSVDDGSAVSGFTFRGGTSDDKLAGGLRIYSGVVTNCVVANCAATASGSTGGGVYMYGTGSFLGSTVSNCTCNGNGGGVFMTGGTVRGCRFLGNTATGMAGGAYVGGVLDVAFDDCEIVGNKASVEYPNTSHKPSGLLLLRPISVGGLDVRRNAGGGVYLIDGATLHDSTIVGHSATRGGGVYAPRGTIERCVIGGNSCSQFGGGVFIENGTIRNCLVTCNTNSNYGASYGGGGLFCRGGVSVVNCTVTKNVAYNGQGIWIDGTFTIRNSIVSHNVHYRSAGVVTNVFGCGADGLRVVGEAGSIYNSCVNDDCYLEYPAFANHLSIVADPLFADAANGDWTLSWNSPCVNAGSNGYVTKGEVDLLGNPRIHRFGGRAKYDVVDMGCYESPWRHMNGLQILVR